ncbi:signal recognition particle, SRP9/SRP14 subunit [Armillaria luteobubalina]|uniref:Signal recognition particle subunit SRP14 n=1 Tax=Armillaria luteobubalina TaxID=153913 RepID=A0AA39QF30_9AGAR|nr:signal recognition particle, SRP9/SRP14 subunit [Armillaria luteobubalina]
MQLVDNDKFLRKLSELFESSSKDNGSIWLTHKRLTHDGEDTAMKHEEGEADVREYPCLVRLSDGGEIKFSTQVRALQLHSVSSADLHKFHSTYGSLLKASMSTLRKRDKKREKQRAEEIARRKKKLSEPIVVEGKKRGNGRRKRQRMMRAALKQQTAIQKLQEREEAKAKAS